ncbi:MAG: hypothetical protein WD628_02285, partial [Thermomicrobiales bacterium]
MSATAASDHDRFVYRSPFVDAVIPDIAITPAILRCAAEKGDAPALIDGLSGRVVTYRQLSDDIRAVTAGLALRGLAKGDVLATARLAGIAGAK